MKMKNEIDRRQELFKKLPSLKSDWDNNTVFKAIEFYEKKIKKLFEKLEKFRVIKCSVYEKLFHGMGIEDLSGKWSHIMIKKENYEKLKQNLLKDIKDDE